MVLVRDLHLHHLGFAVKQPGHTDDPAATSADIAQDQIGGYLVEAQGHVDPQLAQHRNKAGVADQGDALFSSKVFGQ